MRYLLRHAALSTLVVLPAALLPACGAGLSSPAPPAVPSGAGHAPAAGAVPDTSPGAGSAPRSLPNQVVIDNFAFKPARLTVPAGTRVTWVNRDDVPHTATSTARPRLFDSGTLDTDDQFAHVFTTPGTYDYFCAVHPHMTGQIIVK
jgi:plastocyanin